MLVDIPTLSHNFSLHDIAFSLDWTGTADKLVTVRMDEVFWVHLLLPQMIPLRHKLGAV